MAKCGSISRALCRALMASAGYVIDVEHQSLIDEAAGFRRLCGQRKDFDRGICLASPAKAVGTILRMTRIVRIKLPKIQRLQFRNRKTF